jgi:predicted RNase H-like nuclease (RuvC/YqgF family)
MSAPRSADSRTAAAIASRRRRSETAVQRVRDTITALHREQSRITVAALARRAGVSRTFVYDNPEARAAVTAALADTDQQRRNLHATPADGPQAGWRERALNAEDALKSAHAEIARQRIRIGELLGQIRDLQAEWDDQTIARITTENTTLKQQVRQLTADNRTLEERLAAARSTLRFQDRRLTDLETRIADPTALT